ncbi:hypothetical protein [Acidovorax sp. SDU_ACID1]|uniref:phage fiber-tail adaptor protein n=1 Tax=Acidovorax sp. SDU_ACID1 TaxID=3136632 RepID=UPI003872AF0F
MPFAATQQPRDVRDYDLDYSEFLPPDDILVDAEVFVEPPTGLSVTFALSHPRVKVWVQGGANGDVYKITVVAYTNDGRAKEEELKVRIKDY